jgi:hypothetical protein
MYLTCVHSTDSLTNCALMVHLYLQDAMTEEIVNLLGAKLDAMQAARAPSSLADIYTVMTVDAVTDTRISIYLDDDLVASGTYALSPHLETTPHAHIVILPTFSATTYGLTVLASR